MRHRSSGLAWAVCAVFGAGAIALVASTGGSPAAEGDRIGATPEPVFSLPAAAAADDAFEFTDAWPGATFDSPICVAVPADGSDRVFVVQRTGKILSRKKQRSAEAPPPAKEVIDLGSLFDKRAIEEGQGGLLTLAFHPQFKSNGRFFVFYGTGNPNKAVIAAYKMGPDGEVADARSAQVLLSIPKVHAAHYGGGLAFGPDGKLYVGLGDSGTKDDPDNIGQDVRKLEGKILRLDVDTPGAPYTVPPDNPWAASGKGVKGEIWAYGLRNPFRISFDRDMGTLWEGDPGQKAREEINLVPRAGNLGWAIMEGSTPTPERPAPPQRPPDLVGPVFDYGRDMGSCSVGGVVYRGQRCASIRGHYIFSDFMKPERNVFALPLDASGKTTTGAPRVLGDVGSCCSINEDAQGELYFCALEDGKVLTLKPKR
jgi:glucose/arabinose dehydrogenase